MAPVRKRPSASSESAAKRRRTVKQNVDAVAAALKKSQPFVPKSVASMLAAAVATTAGVPRTARHRIQVSLVDMMADVLKTMQADLQKEAAEAQAKVDESQAEKASRQAAVEAGSTKLVTLQESEHAKQEESKAAKRAVTEAQTRLTVITRTCGETSTASVDANAKLTRLLDIQDGANSAWKSDALVGAQGSASLKIVLAVAKELLEFPAVGLIPASLQKPPRERGAFDAVLQKELEDDITREVAKLRKVIDDSEPSKALQEAAVKDCEGELNTEIQKETGATVAWAQAKSAVFICKRELAVAKKAATTGFAVEAKRVAANLKVAKAKSETFEKGAFAAFQDLKKLLPLGQAENLLEKIEILPYGVLGSQKRLNKDIREKASVPDSTTAFVDPAGLHHVQPPGGPAGAGGAAQAIYKFLRISDNANFPQDVIDAVKSAGDAKYHCYAQQSEDPAHGSHVGHAIHAVGPDLRGLYASDGTKQDVPTPPSLDEALALLSAAYANIFKEFISSGLPKLRLLPVSGAIFAGGFLEEMPSITASALQRGFAGSLSKDQQDTLLSREIGLCIFEEKELPLFKKALADAAKLFPQDEYDDVLRML